MGRTAKQKIKRKQKKKATELYDKQHENELENIPTTFVFRYGGSSTLQKKAITAHLRDDFREIFAPYTAKNLQERNSNSMKDFVSVGTSMGIDFFHVFSGSDFSLFWRIMKIPQGPTITLKIKEYSLMKEVQAVMGAFNGKFTSPPLVIINGFPKDKNEYQLLSTTILNTFAPLSAETFNPDKCKRCVLFSYDKSEDAIHFRHYSITQKKLGVDRTKRRIERLSHTNVNLRKVNDISDYLLREVDSESEGEVDTHTQLPEEQNSQKVALKLKEIGPRMVLDLVKVDEGIYTEKCKTLFNKMVEMSEEERRVLIHRQQEAAAKKKQRREEQERNVEKKKKKKEELKQASLKKDDNKIEKEDEEGEEGEEEENEDLEWYKKEVGKMPEPEEMITFSKPQKKKQSTTGTHQKRKTKETEASKKKIKKDKH